MFHIKLGLTSPIEIKIPYTKYLIGRENVGEVRCQSQDLQKCVSSSSCYKYSKCSVYLYFHLHPIGRACPIRCTWMEAGAIELHRTEWHLQFIPKRSQFPQFQIPQVRHKNPLRNPCADVAAMWEPHQVLLKLSDEVMFAWQTNPLTTLGPIAYSYWAKRRALYSALLSTIIFHALQDSLKLWISNKRSWVSNAVSAPISTFAAPTNKFGTKTVNCTSLSKYNTSGSITWDWRDLPHPDTSSKPQTFIIWMKAENLAYAYSLLNVRASKKHKHSSYEWNLRIWPTHLVSLSKWEHPKTHKHSSYESKLRIWPTYLVSLPKWEPT